MNKTKLLKYVNPLLLILMLAQFILIFLSQIIEISWNYTFHHYNGYAIGILVALHIYLNMTWFRTTYFKKKKKSTNMVAGSGLSDAGKVREKQGEHA